MNCFVKSDLYPRPDGTVDWTAIAFYEGNVALLGGTAGSADEAYQQVSDAVLAWTGASEYSKETLVKRVVSDTTGHADNCN